MKTDDLTFNPMKLTDEQKKVWADGFWAEMSTISVREILIRMGLIEVIKDDL